jgi:hypothetical protein
LPASIDEVLDAVQRDLGEAKKESKSTLVIKELVKKEAATGSTPMPANAEVQPTNR